MSKEFNPYIGQMIQVRQDKKDKWEKREFLSMTPDGYWVCWVDGKFGTVTWAYARPLDIQYEKKGHDGTESHSGQ